MRIDSALQMSSISQDSETKQKRKECRAWIPYSMNVHLTTATVDPSSVITCEQRILSNGRMMTYVIQYPYVHGMWLLSPFSEGIVWNKIATESLIISGTDRSLWIATTAISFNFNYTVFLQTKLSFSSILFYVERSFVYRLAQAKHSSLLVSGEILIVMEHQTRSL
jgi:hypothetical protein